MQRERHPESPAPTKPRPSSESGATPKQLSTAETKALFAAAGGSALPHATTLQRAFGRHDLSGVTAHIGGQAKTAAESVGARAYATGSSIAFAAEPDLWLAAHEAAHVVQQRNGKRPDGGIGSTGDAFEQHADRVADAVVEGRPAESILDEMASGGSSPETAVQLDPHDRSRARPASPFSMIKRVIDVEPARVDLAGPNDQRSLRITNESDAAIVLEATIHAGFEIRGLLLDGIILDPGVSIDVDIVCSPGVDVGEHGWIDLGASGQRHRRIPLKVQPARFERHEPRHPFGVGPDSEAEYAKRYPELEKEPDHVKRRRNAAVQQYLSVLEAHLEAVEDGYDRATKLIAKPAKAPDGFAHALLETAASALLAGTGAGLGAIVARRIASQIGNALLAEMVQEAFVTASREAAGATTTSKDLKQQFERSLEQRLTNTRVGLAAKWPLLHEGLYQLDPDALETLNHVQATSLETGTVATLAMNAATTAWINFLARYHHGAATTAYPSAPALVGATSEPPQNTAILEHPRQREVDSWGVLHVKLWTDLSLRRRGMTLDGVGTGVREHVRTQGTVRDVQVNKVIYVSHVTTQNPPINDIVIQVSADGHVVNVVGNVELARAIELAERAQSLSLRHIEEP